MRTFPRNGTQLCTIGALWAIFACTQILVLSADETSHHDSRVGESLDETREVPLQTQDKPVLDGQSTSKEPSQEATLALLLHAAAICEERQNPDAEVDGHGPENGHATAEPTERDTSLLTGDDRLRAAVGELLQRKMSEGVLRDFGVRVTCQEGLVLLSGEVKSVEQRETLIRCVRSIPGVINTIADLKIYGTSPLVEGRKIEPELEETELIELVPPNRPVGHQKDFKSQEDSVSGSGVHESASSNLGEPFTVVPDQNSTSDILQDSLPLSTTGSGIPTGSKMLGGSSLGNFNKGRSRQASRGLPAPIERIFTNLPESTESIPMGVSPSPFKGGPASSYHSISSLTPNAMAVGVQISDGVSTTMPSTDSEMLQMPGSSLPGSAGTSDLLRSAMVHEPARQERSRARPIKRILQCGRSSGKAVCSLCQCLGRFTCSCCAQEELTFGTEGTYLGVIGEGNNQLVVVDDLTGETAVSDAEIGFAVGQRFWLGVEDNGVGIVGEYWLLGSRLIDANVAYVPPSDIAFQSNYVLDLHVFDLLYFHEFCCRGCTFRASLGGRYANLDRGITLTASGKSGGVFINGNTRSNYDSDGFGGVAGLAGRSPIRCLGGKRANSQWCFFWEFAGSILQTNAVVQGRSAVNAFHSSGSAEFSNSVDEDHVFWDGITANGMLQLGVSRSFAFPNKKCFGNLFLGFEGHVWETASVEVNAWSQASVDAQGGDDFGASIRGNASSNPNSLALAGFVWGISVFH